MIELMLGTMMVGLATAVLSYSGADSFRRGFLFVESDFRDKLRRLRVNTQNLRKILLFWLVFALATVFVMWIVFNLPILGLTMSSLLVCLPWYVVRRMSEKRQEKIEDQLADAMVSLSSAIKAGLSLAQALDILAQQTPVPICQEFQQIVGEYQLGKPMERCLLETKQRLRSENFALFAAAIEASRQSGGRLNETVDRIAHSVRELQRLERKILSETAQARASAFYMALAPIAVLAFYYFVMDPQGTKLFFQRLGGQIILGTALILNLIAYLWARVILNPEI